MPHDTQVPVVSAVIVTWNSGDLAGEAQRSFEAAFEGLPVETIVVDNASVEPRFPSGAIAIRNDRNTGFGAACNTGAAAARAPVLLFLNPDARLGAGRWRDVLAHFDAHPDVAAIGVRRVDPGGEGVPEEIPAEVNLAGVLRDVVRAGARQGIARSSPAGAEFEAVAWLPASCLFVRRSAFAAMGGFDEAFFLYFEDVDLCRRLRLARQTIVLAHIAEASHPESGHEKYHDRRRIECYFESLLTYFAKWNLRALPVVRLLALARLILRAAYWTLRRLGPGLGRAEYRERMAGYRAAARAVVRPRFPRAQRGVVPFAAAQGNGGSRPHVSVCIPTYNRRELLLRTLDALGRQTLDSARFEVVVADDGSTDGTCDAVRRGSTEGCWRCDVRVLELPRAGVAAARNAAASAARAPVLAFTDSDVLPAADWLAAGLRKLETDERAGAVEGRTVVQERSAITPFTHQTESAGGRYVTCNLFVRRAAFESVGGFDPAFGGTRPFREDSDFAFRLLDAGWAIPYEEQALVDHPPHPARLATPLRLARRYRLDPLLRVRHPQRFARDLDVHSVGGVRIARPRERAHAANAACAMAGLVAALGGAPGWTTAALAGAYALTYGLVLAMHRPQRLASAMEALAIVPITAAVPFVYAFSVLEGWARLALTGTGPTSNSTRRAGRE